MILLFLPGCVFITEADIAGRKRPPTDTDPVDADGDGFLEDEDCDDGDPEVFPGQTEAPNQIDDDCDGIVDEGTIFYDDDGDGFCEENPCAADCGLSDCSGDCDDTQAVVYPGAPELCDRLSNDCLFEGDERSDRDGDGFSIAEGDPDDLDPTNFPTGVTTTRASVICDIARVEAGTFTMGCDAAWCFFEEQPLHEVTITYDLLVMETELLRDQWNLVGSARNWPFPDCGDNCPVARVSWVDAMHWANLLNDNLGLELCDVEGDPRDCTGWRLPTEAEWEWIARGTSQDRYAGGSNASLVGWVDDNSDDTVHPARLKMPNARGVYDLTGNVWEWTWDAPNDYPFDPQVDPYKWPADDLEQEGERVQRGASARVPADFAHVTVRSYHEADSTFYDETGDPSIDNNPENPFNYHGFRLVRRAP